MHLHGSCIFSSDDVSLLCASLVNYVSDLLRIFLETTEWRKPLDSNGFAFGYLLRGFPAFPCVSLSQLCCVLIATLPRSPLKTRACEKLPRTHKMLTHVRKMSFVRKNTWNIMVTGNTHGPCERSNGHLLKSVCL